MIHCLLPNHPDHATKRLQQTHLGKGLHLSAQKGFLLQGCLRTAVLHWGSTGTVLRGLQAQAPPNTNCTKRCLLETNWCLYCSAPTFSERFRPCTSHNQPILVLVWTPKEKVWTTIQFSKIVINLEDSISRHPFPSLLWKTNGRCFADLDLEDHAVAEPGVHLKRFPLEVPRHCR